jgi:hypothetical protein
VITSVELQQGGDYFTKGGGGCERPPCEGFAWSSGKEKCDVAIIERPGRPNSDEGPMVSLFMAGKADCRAVSAATCADDVEQVSRIGATLETHVTLTLPDTSTTESTTTTTTTETTTEDAAPTTATTN